MTEKRITTIEEALTTVRENGWALKDVPEDLRTAEVCFAALIQNKSQLFYGHGKIMDCIPEKFYDEMYSRLDSNNQFYKILSSFKFYDEMRAMFEEGGDDGK